MAEQSAQSDSAARLIEAIRAVVAEGGGFAASPTKPEIATQSPGALNIFFFVLLIVNLVFLVALIPTNLLEELHWDLLKELIPIVGGSFFVVFASWYQDLTLKIVRSKIFRAVDVCFSLWFLIFLMPWVHITPNIQPVDAQTRYFRDDDRRPIDPDKPILVSLKAHTFTVEWSAGDDGKSDPPRDPTQKRTFKMDFWQLFIAGINERHAHPYWPRLYTLQVQIKQTPGIQVKIVGVNGTSFDPDFLASDLRQYSLQKQVDGSMTLTLPNWVDPEWPILLPVGQYTMTPYKQGCTSGNPKAVLVGPGQPSLVEFAQLEGCHP